MSEEFVKEIKEKYPQFRFREGERFFFRPPRTIILAEISNDLDKLLALHELGHALCGHKSFDQDIVRLKMEREAWERAKALCPEFAVVYDEDFVEEQLDSYRDWLHSRSKCPKCGLTRYQEQNGKYYCPKCELLETTNP